MHICNKSKSSDTISQFSIESSTSGDSKEPVYIAAGDIRRRLSENISAPKGKFEVRRKVHFQELEVFMVKSVISLYIYMYHIYSAIRQGFPLSRMTTNN